jgi:hypothetical protein
MSNVTAKVMIQSLNASSLLVGVDGTLHTVERKMN